MIIEMDKELEKYDNRTSLILFAIKIPNKIKKIKSNLLKYFINGVYL